MLAMPSTAASVFHLLESLGFAEDGRARIPADLHIHTCVSDGSDTFAHVASLAAKRGLSCIAITNHDTTRGLDAAVAAGEQEGIQVIGGVEISAWDATRQRKVHILGYGLRESSPAVESLCRETLRQRNEASRWQLARLKEEGIEVDERHALSLAARSTCLYKQHIMEALTQAPHNSPEYEKLYCSLFKGEGICARDISYVDMAAAVRAVTADGGIAVLAHPGQLGSYDAVPELVEAGLRGIERFHPDHTPADYDRVLRLARHYGLVCTAGSDYHGRFGRAPYVGHRIPLE